MYLSHKCTLFGSHSVSFCLFVCFKLSQYLRVRYFTNESDIWFFLEKSKDRATLGPTPMWYGNYSLKLNGGCHPQINMYFPLSHSPLSWVQFSHSVATWPLQAFMLWSLVEVLSWLARSHTLISSRESAPVDFHVKKTDYYDKLV